MQLGFIGLGKMGSNMVKALLAGGHEVAAFDRSTDAIAASAKDGAIGCASLKDLVEALAPPRRIWIMVPSGDPVQTTLNELTELCEPVDLLIDGGNSKFTDSKRRGAELATQGFRFMDVGVSGGIWGLRVGYCMMVGGATEDVEAVKPVLDTLAPPDGWAHMGPIGSGHYVKMVHNGIEYGLLQAYGEGFEILEASDYDLDLLKISHLWNQGSVVRSWLLELAELAFKEDGNDLEHVRGYVVDSGEGRWTVQEAIDHDVPAPIITLSLLARMASRQEESFSAKVIAALRHQFGGHGLRAPKG